MSYGNIIPSVLMSDIWKAYQGCTITSNLNNKRHKSSKLNCILILFSFTFAHHSPCKGNCLAWHHQSHICYIKDIKIHLNSLLVGNLTALNLNHIIMNHKYYSYPGYPWNDKLANYLTVILFTGVVIQSIKNTSLST